MKGKLGRLANTPGVSGVWGGGGGRFTYFKASEGGGHEFGCAASQMSEALATVGYSGRAELSYSKAV